MKGRSWAEIDLSAARANISAIREIVGTDRMIMAVVKADAYGHGAAAISRAIEDGVDRLAVADTGEAAGLREAGVRVPIHILGGLTPEECEAAVALDLRPAIGSIGEAKRLSDAAIAMGATVTVHLHIDSGMGRYGERLEDAVATAKAVSAMEAVELEGVSSHFADAEGDLGFTREQLARFDTVLGEMKSAGIATGLVHCANSSGIALHEDSRFDMVRPGLAVYGLSYCPEMSAKISLTPVMTWKSRVVFAKTIRAGEPVGYGMTWKAPSDRAIATVSCGYADGYQRALSNNTEVILNGVRVPIAGRVAMDYMNIDPTGVDFEVGDEVIMMGRSGDAVITGEELAERAGTIPHVITTCLGRRTERVYLDV